jgi:tetratricopeptide (TPR) repeat protein
MLCVVVVFGVHSFVDWTWYVPGTAGVALLCAGWVAGRGPLDTAIADGPSADRPLRSDGVGPARPRRWLRRPSPMSAAVAGAVVIAALLAAWAQWQPQRGEDSSQLALSQLASDPATADAAARAAVARDPLSVQALFSLSAIQQATGQPELARATLQRAVRLQPSNPETWLHLGEYDLSTTGAPAGGSAAEGGARSALNELGAAIYLNPQSIAPELVAQGNTEAITIQNDYVRALRASSR